MRNSGAIAPSPAFRADLLLLGEPHDVSHRDSFKCRASRHLGDHGPALPLSLGGIKRAVRGGLDPLAVDDERADDLHAD